jgi:uncharacterized protein YkwD
VRPLVALLALVTLCAATPSPADDWVPLDIPVTHLYVKEADESAMVADVNALRRAEGRKPLVVDAKLTKAARDFARDMLTRRFFGHRDPDGHSFAERLRASGYAFHRAGENLAFNRDEHAAQAALEASQGHRHNMVDPGYSRIGVGVIAASVYGTAYVQEFAGE